MSNSSLNWEDVLHAIELVWDEADRIGVEPHHLAEQKRAAAAMAGDYNAARIWRDVWVCVMTQKYLPATLRRNEVTPAEQGRLDGRTKH